MNRGTTLQPDKQKRLARRVDSFEHVANHHFDLKRCAEMHIKACVM
jgi:hypothetical protein